MCVLKGGIYVGSPPPPSKKKYFYIFCVSATLKDGKKMDTVILYKLVKWKIIKIDLFPNLVLFDTKITLVLSDIKTKIVKFGYNDL